MLHQHDAADASDLVFSDEVDRLLLVVPVVTEHLDDRVGLAERADNEVRVLDAAVPSYLHATIITGRMW